MKKTCTYLAISGLLSLSTFHASAHEAHVHGVGKLDVVLEGSQLSLHLSSPLMNLLGFEHAAKSQKDRLATQKMAKQLRDAGKIFITTPEAECAPTSVKLMSPVLEPVLLGEAVASMDKQNVIENNEHADLEGDFIFHCAHPELLRNVEAKRLFDVFQGFKQIDVQLVIGNKQSALTLTPDARSTMKMKQK